MLLVIQRVPPENITCVNYEDQLWRVIMNLRPSLYKASVIFVAFNTNCRLIKNFSKNPEYEFCENPSYAGVIMLYANGQTDGPDEANSRFSQLFCERAQKRGTKISPCCWVGLCLLVSFAAPCPHLKF